MSTTLKNIRKPVIEVCHQNLKRAGDSAYKSHCPVCPEGLLLMQRDPKDILLEENDLCVVCGQHFVYTDILRSMSLEYKKLKESA